MVEEEIVGGRVAGAGVGGEVSGGGIGGVGLAVNGFMTLPCFLDTLDFLAFCADLDCFAVIIPDLDSLADFSDLDFF